MPDLSRKADTAPDTPDNASLPNDSDNADASPDRSSGAETSDRFEDSDFSFSDFDDSDAPLPDFDDSDALLPAPDNSEIPPPQFDNSDEPFPEFNDSDAPFRPIDDPDIPLPDFNDLPEVTTGVNIICGDPDGFDEVEITYGFSEWSASAFDYENGEYPVSGDFDVSEGNPLYIDDYADDSTDTAEFDENPDGSTDTAEFEEDPDGSTDKPKLSEECLRAAPDGSDAIPEEISVDAPAAKTAEIPTDTSAALHAVIPADASAALHAVIPADASAAPPADIPADASAAPPAVIPADASAAPPAVIPATAAGIPDVSAAVAADFMLSDADSAKRRMQAFMYVMPKGLSYAEQKKLRESLVPKPNTRKLRCCFTGNRGIHADAPDLSLTMDILLKWLCCNNVGVFMSGSALGFDTLTEFSMSFRNAVETGKRLTLLIPNVSQSKFWSKADTVLLDIMKTRSDSAVLCSEEEYEPDTMLFRDRLLSDSSDVSLSFSLNSYMPSTRSSGTQYTMNHLHKNGKTPANLSRTPEKAAIIKPVQHYRLKNAPRNSLK